MAIQTFPLPSDSGASPKTWYQAIRTMPGFVEDAAQAAAVDELDALWHQMVEFKSRRNLFLGRSLLSPEVPKGLYLWGGVGRGKTFLMDAFYASLPYQRKRRIHFHNFMAEVHRELKLLADESDPLIALADRIAESIRLLCLDEFHVDDIADAMILGRLLEALIERGVVLVTTSNHAPDGLYLHGLQRQNFLPAIDLLKRELKVLQIDSGKDYRLRAPTREPLFLAPADSANEGTLESLFELIAAGKQQNAAHLEIRGRNIPVNRSAPTVAWFEFRHLCGGARDQQDYLEIAYRFPTVFLSHIPQLGADNADQAKRFTWLIDVLYDNKVRLVATAAAEPDRLYRASAAPGDFARTASRLAEMQTQTYLKQLHRTQRVTL